MKADGGGGTMDGAGTALATTFVNTFNYWFILVNF